MARSAALCVLVLGMVCAASAAMTPAQQAAWNVAQQYANYQFAGQFSTMCSSTMSPNPSFLLDWNPAFVPWGGNWVGAAGATGCPALFTGFAETWTQYCDWAIVTHMVLHSVNQDATAVYGTLTLDSTTKSTGNKLTNITVGHILYIGQSNGATVVTGLTLMADSAAMGQSMCSSNAMKCAAWETSPPVVVEEVSLEDLPAPKLQTVKGLALPHSHEYTSTEVHSLAMLLNQKHMTAMDTPQQTNLQNLMAYWNAIFTGNMAGAEAYLSDTATLVWHGQFDWVPVAGTFIGKSGWEKFFKTAFVSTRNFTFTEFSYEGCNGNTCTMHWMEHSIVKSTGRAVDGLVNLVFYTFTTDNLIQHIDVLVDSMSYATRFCPGFVVCDN